MTVYTRAVEAEAIAAEIIAKHHPHLKGERIEYVFRDAAAKQGGKTVLGKARKIGGLNAWLAGDSDDEPGASFFVVELAGDVWADMPDAAKRALIDHELSHCGLDQDGRPKLLPHDLEEFAAIVERHGLWKRDVRVFTEVAQLSLASGPGWNWDDAEDAAAS